MASIVIFFHIVVFSNAIAQLNSNSIIDLNSQLKNTEVVIDSLLNIRRSVYEYSMTTAWDVSTATFVSELDKEKNE